MQSSAELMQSPMQPSADTVADAVTEAVARHLAPVLPRPFCRHPASSTPMSMQLQRIGTTTARLSFALPHVPSFHPSSGPPPRRSIGESVIQTAVNRGWQFDYTRMYDQRHAALPASDLMHTTLVLERISLFGYYLTRMMFVMLDTWTPLITLMHVLHAQTKSS